MLQIPVGVLADTLGPRLIVTAGAFVAGVGSLLFGMAQAWEIAAIGRTLVGVGVAVTFVSLLKVCANWFPADRFATLNGVTMLAGNLGAVVAGAPLAWLITVVSWRSVFVGLGLTSIAIGALTWAVVRDRPEQSGYAPLVSGPAATSGVRWTGALAQVLANPANWPSVFVNIGVGGSYLAFAGLWVVPYLREVRGLSQTMAAQHASTLVLGVALGSVVIGLLSDRLRNERGVMIAYTFLYAFSWLPWLLHMPLPIWASYGWCLLMGLLVPGFVLTWTIAKETNRPEHAGMAISVVNVGIFLGAGVCSRSGRATRRWTGARGNRRCVGPRNMVARRQRSLRGGMHALRAQECSKPMIERLRTANSIQALTCKTRSGHGPLADISEGRLRRSNGFPLQWHPRVPISPAGRGTIAWWRNCPRCSTAWSSTSNTWAAGPSCPFSWCSAPGRNWTTRSSTHQAADPHQGLGPPCSRCRRPGERNSPTLTGKKMEVPVRKLLLGAELGQVASPDSMPTNPAWTSSPSTPRRFFISDESGHPFID